MTNRSTHSFPRSLTIAPEFFMTVLWAATSISWRSNLFAIPDQAPDEGFSYAVGMLGVAPVGGAHVHTLRP